MTALFLDSSAIAKRYLAEVGSAWVTALTGLAAGNEVWLSRVTGVEFASAVARRCRDGQMTQVERDTALVVFRTHGTTQYRFVDLDAYVAQRAADALLSHPLRAYDAVQLASALVLNEQFLSAGIPALLFVCADDRLLAAAAAEGLPAENPLAHP